MSEEFFSNVLLVEDEPAHVELIRRALKGLVGEVLVAKTGGEALEKLSSSYTDLVLCDLHLPDMTALEILRQARIARPGLPFVVLTSSSDLESAVSAMRGGASDFMVKSFSNELRGRIELTLARLADEERRRGDELRLRAERDAFWAAAHATTDGLAILGTGSQIVFSNNAFAAFCKSIDPEDQEHDVVKLIGKINPAVADALNEQLNSERSGGLWRSELALQVGSEKNKLTRYFELNLSVVEPPQFENIVVAPERRKEFRKIILWSRDITGRKDQERINRDLLVTTTHDLKGPLGAMINGSELLDQLITDKPPKVDEILTRIASSARNCISMIDELLSARRIQDGVFVVKPRLSDAQHELEDIVLDYLPMAKARGLQLIARPGEPVQVFADTLGLKRILGNLVSNALKFTPTGGRVELSAEKVGDETFISVADTGLGIDAQLQHTLFEKYGRLDRDDQIDGTGLGLFVTKNIVDAHSGRIEVKSTPGKGTTFIIAFPDP